jgi:hypothetical protein
MFRYLEKHSWWSTLEEKQVATIDELVKLCKAGEVERVIIPNTYYGYGSTLIDDSNIRSIQRHYKRSRFKMMQYNLTMSASQFIRNEHYREMIESLLEDYPLFDDSDHSMLESETQLEFLVDELFYVLSDDETQLEVNWTKETILETLEAGEWDERIEWWDYVEIDNDGATPYATEDQIKALAELLKARGPAK